MRRCTGGCISIPMGLIPPLGRGTRGATGPYRNALVLCETQGASRRDAAREWGVTEGPKVGEKE